MDYAEITRGQNFFDIDVNVQQLLRRLIPDAFERWQGDLSSFGAWVGSDLDEAATYIDRHGPPVLEAYGRDGERINRVRHNPAWIAANRELYRRGIVGLNYLNDPAPFVVTFTMSYLLSQADVSLHCPVAMTASVAYILHRFARDTVREAYLPQLIRMDGEAVTAGTWATELHGGSDIGATTTTARQVGNTWQLDGLKWFTSNVDGGIAVATARPEGAPPRSEGLGLYLVPMHLSDGRPNPMHIRRLKDKLGTCGVPTGEVDLNGTFALEIAGPPEGFKLMMEALGCSRIHNAISAVGLERRAFLEAISYATHRRAFGQTITTFPMVQDELIDMMVRLEAGLNLAFEAAHAFDQAWTLGLDQDISRERTWLRLATALAKYLTADDANVVCRAAIELIGGNGYTYDYVTPRLLRDAQALTIWEGPANIQALELIRLLQGRSSAMPRFVARMDAVLAPAEALLPRLAAPLRRALRDCQEAVDYLAENRGEAPYHARKLLVLMAEVLAAGLLLEEAISAYERDDARKALVALWYIERRFDRPQRRGIGPRQTWANDYFQALTSYDAVPLTDAVTALLQGRVR